LTGKDRGLLEEGYGMTTAILCLSISILFYRVWKLEDRQADIMRGLSKITLEHDKQTEGNGQ